MQKASKLAIDGGRKTWTKGGPVWPRFDLKTDRMVLDILHSGKVNYWSGPVGMQFEAAWAKWLGVRNAVSVSSGTVALHVALTALGIGAGDEVVCTPSLVAASSAADFLCGARPVFCAVGMDGLIDPRGIEPCLTAKTRAIVVSHCCGMVADMNPVLKIAKRHGIRVVEDCSQCVGGVYRGRKAGTLGTVSCFSFGPVDHFTTGGEGGMVCCNDDGLAWEMRSVRDHGYDVRAKLDLLKSEGKQIYVHRRVGYNFRLTEIQSAIGLGELRRFDKWNLARRRKIGQTLVRALGRHPLVESAPVDTATRQNAYWCVPFVLDVTRLKNGTTEDFVSAVAAEGASVCHLSPAVAESTISFLAYPTLGVDHVRADVRAFEKVAAAMMR